jgi:hypothetical protein
VACIITVTLFEDWRQRKKEEARAPKNVVPATRNITLKNDNAGWAFPSPDQTVTSLTSLCLLPAAALAYVYTSAYLFAQGFVQGFVQSFVQIFFAAQFPPKDNTTKFSDFLKKHSVFEDRNGQLARTCYPSALLLHCH